MNGTRSVPMNGQVLDRHVLRGTGGVAVEGDAPVAFHLLEDAVADRRELRGLLAESRDEQPLVLVEHETLIGGSATRSAFSNLVELWRAKRYAPTYFCAVVLKSAALPAAAAATFAGK